ncbi:MAG: hypothetical protein ACJAZS_000073 [Alteromonas naphthalenivorans]|jgi:hypothetical protein
MINRWVFCIVLWAVSCLEASGQKQQMPLFDYLVATSKTHFIEPSWVLPLFFSMNVKEFDASWDFLTTLIKDKPWYLICSNYSDYSECKQRDVLIAHCKSYDTFLQHLFVNPKTGDIQFFQGPSSSKSYISIYDYWKRTHNKNASHFYAFYFDRIAATYIEATNNAFLNIDHADYSNYLQRAGRDLGVLYCVLHCLTNSSYEVRYSAHIKQYQEVRQLLIEEKRMLDEL